MKRNERMAETGVRTEKLGRKVRAQDDGALAGATDMRPSTSIEGCTAIESTGFSPLPGATYFTSYFVRLPRANPSSGRLISTTCIRRECRHSGKRTVISNHRSESSLLPRHFSPERAPNARKRANERSGFAPDREHCPY